MRTGRRGHGAALRCIALSGFAILVGVPTPCAASLTLGAIVQDGDGSEREAEARAAERQRLLADLLARMELGLQAEVLELGRPLVAPGGLLSSDGQAVATVARALFAAGLESDADELLDTAQVTPDTRPLIDLERARIALERDQLDLARSLLQSDAGSESPVKHPLYPDSWLLLARVYARGGRLDLAGQLARKMLDLDPLHAEAASAWHLLSRDAVRRRDGAAASECLERAEFMRNWHDVMRARRLQIRLAPADPLPRLGLALGWMQVDRWSRAEATLEELLTVAPDYCRAYFHLGEARRLAGDTDGAVAAYDLGLECNPTDLRLTMNRGLLRLVRGDVEAGIADLVRVVESEQAGDPLFLSAHLELARAFRAKGDEARSQAAYDRYVELGGQEPLEAD
ncbi:MAG: tetratricopeptide repeat protein [Planctomycetota bacterium]